MPITNSVSLAKPAKVLVSGGAGFVGGHLVDALVVDGRKVVVLDDLTTGRLENIRRYLHENTVVLVEGDIRNRRTVEKAVKGVDTVFHLAAITSVPYSVKHPDITWEVNVAGTMNILEASFNFHVRQFIFISTCAVYGESEYLPIDEQHPTNPASPYSKSKLEAERCCKEFQTEHGLNTTILRLFNVYGAKMRSDQYGGVIVNFARLLRSGKQPVINGDGEQTRDFVHVQDVIESMKLVAGNDRASGQTFNIATGKQTTINQLAHLLADLIGVRKLEPQYKAARSGDVKHSCANIRKAKRSLGYKPQVSLREGLSSLMSVDQQL